MSTAQNHRCDIVIIGGSIIGSAVAYFLLREGKGGRVLLVEPDPSYEFAAAPRKHPAALGTAGKHPDVEVQP